MKILPFRGYRYNTQKISCLDDVISLPYDQFEDDWDNRFHGRHPYNISHIIMNPESPKDSSTSNRYTRSKQLLNSWIEEGIFIRDEQDSIYPYYQEYSDPSGGIITRKGVITLGEITDYRQGVVFPHEQTLRKPKEDRLKLLRSTLMDSGLIFMLYSDPLGKLEDEIDSLIAQSEGWCAQSSDLTKNRFWRISDNRGIARIQQLMTDKSVIIADGHHRYEVAREFQKENIEYLKNNSKWQAYRYKLINLVRMESPSLRIRPIHRILFNIENFNPRDFLKKLRTFFLIKPIQFDPKKKIESINKLLSQLKREQDKEVNVFGIFIPSLKQMALLSFIPNSKDLVNWPSNKSVTWRKLDVSILQVVILNNLMGIRENELAEGNKVDYVSSSQEAFNKLTELSGQCLFLLNATPIKQVQEVVHSKDLLPQKSTHFHPKLMEGLVFAKHI